MNLHIDQSQINQICQSLWAIAHALECIASAVVASAVIRAIFNK